MEKTSSSNTLSLSFSLAAFIGFLLFDGALKWITGFKKFYSSSWCFFQSQKVRSEMKIAKSESLKRKASLNEKVEDVKLISREDVEMVMGNLRIFCNHDEDILQERLGSNEVSVLFEDKEPSVEEVKEAFNVFDENRDGFIDAAELQRVLCSLGFTQGAKLEECENMIIAFDENRDGRIDFNEFLRLMEKSFCIENT